MEYTLTTQNLTKKYRKSVALEGLTMNVPEGSIYGLVGENGAGKTTLIRIVSGIQQQTSGEYTLYGRKSRDKDIGKSRKRVGAVVEAPAIYTDMTAEQNLIAQYRLLGIPDYSEISDLLELVGLAHTGDKKAGNFSLGMKQRLGIAVALAGNPDMLILDEPIN